ncbi:hypothetical protein [Acetobacter oeni]|uniref:hypothetical protein n=1 Tax=Acetobacter oeni TaxID=304077 RepID=UPI001A7E8F02|nr:hypothetical protein [Acetobacter oeni]
MLRNSDRLVVACGEEPGTVKMPPPDDRLHVLIVVMAAKFIVTGDGCARSYGKPLIL